MSDTAETAPETVATPIVTPAAAVDGLVWGYKFSEDGDAELLAGEKLLEALEAQESWVWLNFEVIDEKSRAAIAAIPHLPPAAVEMLLSTDERQRIVTIGQVIGGVVADYERDSLDAKRLVRWQFVMAPHVFISAHRAPGRTLHQLHLELQSGRKMPDVLRLFDALIHEFTTATSLLLNDTSNTLDEMEESLLEDKDVALEMLGKMRRRLVRMHRQAMPLRAVLHHMLTHHPAWVTDQALKDCQHVAQRLDGLHQDLESFQDRAHALQDELKGREAEKTNQRLTVLSILSALLLPPTLISGIFGMNVEGLPLRDGWWGFPITLGMMAASTAAMLIMLRRIKLI